MGASGSVDRGPSELYLQLLKGEITSKQYMKRIGKDVAQGRLPGDRPTPPRPEAQPERSRRR